MKLNRLETHDRLQHFTKRSSQQSADIGECCQNLIDRRPFGNHPFYIFAHTRTDDDGVTQRLIWQPRLTKPKAETNSMLFKAYPGQDMIKVIWMIPKPELWAQYLEGKMTENKTVLDSIMDFTNNKSKLEARESDDLQDWQIDNIYRELSMEAKAKKSKATPKTSEAS